MGVVSGTGSRDEDDPGADLAASGGTPLHESTPDEARQLSAALAAMAGPAPRMARAEDRPSPPPTAPRSPSGCSCRSRAPAASSSTSTAAAGSSARSTSTTRWPASSPSGRRAPSSSSTTAWPPSTATRPPSTTATPPWSGSASHLADIAGRADVPLIVAGDSAGGNLAAVMALRARDRGGPQIALQVLIYPVTDADFDRPSYIDPDNQLLLTREAMVWFWDHYVPDAAQRAPSPTPRRCGAESLAGLPPAVVLTAEHDVLRDEGEAYAERLAARPASPSTSAATPARPTASSRSCCCPAASAASSRWSRRCGPAPSPTPSSAPSAPADATPTSTPRDTETQRHDDEPRRPARSTPSSSAPASPGST